MRKTSFVSASDNEDVGSSKMRRLEPCAMARQISTIEGVVEEFRWTNPHAFILMMVLPSPIAKYERAKAQQVQETRQKALAAPIPGGEVSVGIASPAKH